MRKKHRPDPNRSDQAPCWCDSGNPVFRCCGPLLSRTVTATSSEALMRSRYAAYVLRDTDYLMATWHPHTRPASLDLDPAQRWLGLSINSVSAGGEHDTEGTVEFVARFKVHGRGHRLHERSRFVREQGLWFYWDGVFVR